MFRKENSSCATAKAKDQPDPKPQGKGKKGKKNQGNSNNAAVPARALDTPLRKSDIRNLKQRARDFLLGTEEGKFTEKQVTLVTTILDAVFVANSVATRHLHHAELGKLTLYVRTPNSELGPCDDFVWPYAISQIIWIVQPPMPNTNQVEVAVPTVALLSVLPPGLMPTVQIPPHASKFLCRGAHLMRAGMLNLPSELVLDGEAATGKAALLQQSTPRVAAVAIVGNPQPIAVGVIDSGVRTSTDIGAETKGVGANIWTCYGDDLWQQQVLELEAVPDAPAMVSPYGGASYNDGQYGNVGFRDGQGVLPIVKEGDNEDDEDTKGASAWGEDDREEADDGAVPTDEGAAESVEATEDDKEAPAEGNDGDTQDEQAISQDDLLHQTVCKALLTAVSPKDLPITVANFYANHVLPNRPEGTTIQLKQTKYKKFGAYLQEQAKQKLVTLGPGPNKNNKDKFGYLVSFDKRHPDLLEYKQDHSEEVQQAKESNQAAEASKQLKLVLVNLYVVPHHFVGKLRLDPDAVKAVNASSKERAGTGMLTGTEVRALLESYLEREDLIQVDQVQLDGPLFDALYKKKKGGEVTNDTLTVSRKDMNDAWVAAMNPAYAIVQMPGNKVQKLGQGQPPKVQMEVSMRSGKKFITKLRGMEAYGINGQVLAKDVGRRLACQASVETTSETGPALPKGCVEIVLGGNFADELEALLLGDERLCPGHGGVKNSDYKLPKGSVEVVLRKGVPARKRRGGGKKK